jgi:sensor histidine kinase YesM
MTLLTLVENAIRHGIDPSEEGGRIDVSVRLQDGRCLAEVKDTGVGLSDKQASQGLGTGLANLRERLQLVFAGQAQLSLTALEPHGFCVYINIPAQWSPAVTAPTAASAGA